MLSFGLKVYFSAKSRLQWVTVVFILPVLHHLLAMYIRTVKKQRSKDSKIFYQYTLAQTLRVDGKVKQNAILYLGSESLMEDENNRKIVLEILKAKIFNQKDLFPLNADKELVALTLSYFEKYCRFGDPN